MPANPTYTDGDYSVAFAVTPLVKQPAFEGVNDLLIGTQEFVQARADYAATALDTPHPDDADFLLVKESNFQDLGGGIQQWTRTYAKIPAQRIEGRSLAWQLPGLGFGGTNPITAITAVTGISATDPNAIVTITTGAAHGLTAGDWVFLFLEAALDRYHSQSYTYGQVIAVPGGSSFTIYQGVLGQNRAGSVQNTANYGSAVQGRKPESNSVPARVVFDYTLETEMGDVVILEPQEVRDEANLVTDTYNLNTVPSLMTYQAQVSAGEWIVAQASVARRWQGNIWERETVYVKAQ